MRNIIFYNKKILKNTGIMIFEALDKDQLEIIRALKKTQKSKNISYWTSHCKIFMKIKYLQCEELQKEIKSINDIDFYINYVEEMLEKKEEYQLSLRTNLKILPTSFILGPWAAVYLGVFNWTKMDHLIGVFFMQFDTYLCNLKNPLGAKSYLL